MEAAWPALGEAHPAPAEALEVAAGREALRDRVEALAALAGLPVALAAASQQEAAAED